ncbi:MAG: hypothetical protein HKO59_12030, partial [Phycisphaerales bacterium]|nr:hypothetical protein [Phycisphaerales bacterium]
MTTMPPPTPDALASPPATPSAWPTVIGIIAIIFGVLGMLGGCFGGVSVLMLDQFAELMPEQQSTGFEGMLAWKPW